MSTSATPLRSKSCYAVEGDHHHLVVVQAARSGKTVHFDTVFNDAIEEGSENIAKIARLVTEASRTGKTLLTASLPGTQSVTRTVRAPFASRSKAHKVFPSLLDIQLPFPLEGCVFDFLGTRTTKTSQVEAVAVASRKTDVIQRLEELKQVGLDPEQLDHESLALWTQSIREAQPGVDETRVVVYLGRQHTTFVEGKGETFLRAHATRIGSQSPGAYERLAQRAHQIMEAGTQVETPHWYWTGPGAIDPSFLKKLEELISKNNAVFLRHEDPDTFLARGLAYRVVGESPLACNVRRQDLSHEGILQRNHRSERGTALCTLFIGLFICISSLGWRSVVDHRNRTLQEELTGLAQHLTGFQRVPRGQEVEVVNRWLDEQAAHGKPFLQAFGQPSGTTLKKILNTSAQQGLHLEQVTIRPGFLSLQGTSKDWDESVVLETLVTELGYIAALNRSDAGADERVHFSLKGTTSL